MRYCVLGAGRQGIAIVYDLWKFGDADEILLLDQSSNSLSNVKERLGKLLPTLNLSTETMDVSNHRDLVKKLLSVDVLVSAVPYPLNPQITKAALESSTSMVDLGGHTENVRIQLQNDSYAKEKGISIIPDCGMGPGMNITLALLAMEQLDEVKDVKIWDGGLPKFPTEPWNYASFFNIKGLTNEYYGNAYFIKNSKIVEVPCFEGLENIDFGKDIGVLEAAVTSGGLSTMPWTFEGKIDSLENKTLRYPGHWDKMIAYRQLGLFEEDQVDYNGTLISPRDFYHFLLDPQLKENNNTDFCIMRTRAEGILNGKTVSAQVDTIEYHDKVIGFTAMEKWTGWHASIVAIEIANKRIPSGAISIENALAGKVYLQQANKRNFKIDINIK